MTSTGAYTRLDAQSAGGDSPSARSQHAIAAVAQEIFLFGGQDSGDGVVTENPQVLGDLWVWSTVDRKWTEVEAGTPAPSARYGHAMTAVGQQIFLYGGDKGSGYGE